MGICFELNPIDTLFFKGSEPLIAGQAIANSLFPPPVSVIKGALRTAYLKQNNISFEDYKNNNVNEEIINNIGYCGKEAPFNIKAILLKKQDTYYLPVPLNWFLDISLENKKFLFNKQNNKVNFNNIKIIKTKNQSELLSKIGINCSHSNIPIAELMSNDENPTSLCGKWISLKAFKTKKINTNDIVSENEFISIEYRTGIELDVKKRTTKKGQLYSAGHIRFAPETKLIIILDKNINLKEQDIISLGGERRLVSYKEVKDSNIPNLSLENSENKEFVCFAPIQLTEDNINNIVATYKPKIVAGWDMAKGFHKPTTTWLPAGTVFNKNINNQCIAL